MTIAATIFAVNLFFNQLVEILEKYIKEIERKFCRNDQLLYKFQIKGFQELYYTKDKIKYLLQQCLLKQLTKNIDKGFKALMSFMKEYDDLRALSAEIEKCVEENSVPVNFSQQATDQIVTANSKFALDTFKESVPKLSTVPADLKCATTKEKSELVAPNHPYPSTAPSSSAPITHNESIDTLYSTICKVLNENASLQISFSTLLCTGLPKTGKTTFSHMLLKRSKTNPSPGDNQAVFVKRKCLVTKQETHWKEVTLTDILDQLNCLTTFDCVSKVTEEKASTTKQSYKEIWSIIVLLDIHVNVSMIHLLPKALVTFVVDKFQDVKVSFEKDCDSKELQHFDETLHLLKQVISTNCRKEFGKMKSSFEKMEVPDVEKGDKRIYTAFVATHDQDHPADRTIADKGLSCLLDSINFPKHVDRELLPALHVDGKLLHLVNINDQSDKMAQKLNNSTQRFLDDQTIHRVPIGWLYFMIELKQYSKTSRKYYHCLSFVFAEIWKNKYSIDKDELKVALKFFHHIGLLLYLESEDDAHSYVLCNWIWLFQKIDSLLHGRIPDHGTYEAYNLFMYEGILNQKMISGVSWPFEKEIEVNTLLKLLIDLHIAVPMKRLINKTIEYFIPGRLPAYDGSGGRALSYGAPQCEPLLMIYSSGTSHPSHFSFLAAHLLEKLPEGWMEPTESSENERYTYSNLIIFSVNKSHYVTLYEKVYFLEIQIRSSETPNSNLCYQIQRTLIRAINTACIDRIHREASKVKLGFYCNLCKSSNKHLMIVKPPLSKGHLQVCCCKRRNLVHSITEEKFTDWFCECVTQGDLKAPVNPNVRHDSGYTEAVPQADTTDASLNLEQLDVFKQIQTMPVQELGTTEQYQVAARPNWSEGKLNLLKGYTLVLTPNVHIHNASQTPLSPENTPLAANSPFKNELCLFKIEDIEFSVIEKYLITEDLIKSKEQHEAMVDHSRLPTEKKRTFLGMVLTYNLEECKRFVKCLKKSADEYHPHKGVYVTLNDAIETFESKSKVIASTISENRAIPVEEPSEEITN